MAHYLVRARLKQAFANYLYERLGKREFLHIQPFGGSLTRALENIRHDPLTGEAVWEEEDYCSPPLAMKQRAVLDQYFDEITVNKVSEGEGWTSIDRLPSLWGARL